MNKNKFDKTGDSLKMGTDAENAFVLAAKRDGWKVEEATRNENMYDHIDFKLSNDKLKFTVDVKAEKKLNRSDANTNSKLLFVELKNVQGHNGWLYGKAGYIVFENRGKFCFILRADLVKRVESLVTEEVVYKSSDALYKKYTRQNRRDVITLIKWSDVKDLIRKVL